MTSFLSRTIGMLLLALSVCSWAQPQKQATTVSLASAVAIAMKHNLPLASAYLQREVDRADLALAHHAFEWHYQLSGEGRIQSDDTRRWSIHPQASLALPWGGQLSWSQQWQQGHGDSTIRLSQPFIRGAGAVARLGLLNAETQACINRLRLEQVMTNTVISVIQSYRQVLQSTEAYQVQRLALFRAKQVLQAFQIKVKTGQMPKRSLWQQEAQVLNERIALKGLSNTLENNRQRLLLSLGLKPTDHLSIDPHVPQISRQAVPSFEQVKRDTLMHNLALKQQHFILKQAHRRLEQARDQLRWDLSLEAQASRQGDRQAGLRWQIPVRDKVRQAQLLRAKIAYQQARLQTQHLKRQIMTDVTNTWRNVKHQWHQVDLARSRVTYAEKNYELTLMSRLNGRASAFEVVSQQQRLVQAQMGLIGLTMGFLNSLTRLRAIEGTLLGVWHVALKEVPCTKDG